MSIIRVGPVGVSYGHGLLIFSATGSLSGSWLTIKGSIIIFSQAVKITVLRAQLLILCKGTVENENMTNMGFSKHTKQISQR